jgi:beta-glucosidase
MKNHQKKQAIASRVAELLGSMTLEEKAAQVGSCWMYELQTRGELDPAKLELRFRHGIGQISRVGGASTYPPVEAARVVNHLQKYLVESTRLGIPAIVHEECCVGLMAPGGSIFPEIIGLASTFQPELAGQMTREIRSQMLAIGSRQGLAPVLDVARDPRWGRIEETFGEDPTLVSQFGVEYIRGLQGEDLSQGVLATGKHFVGHSFSQGGLNCGPVHLGWRDLWDVYLPPFQAAIRDAGLATMMNAYPELDGEVVAASKKILTDLLREKLGFDGLVVSDYEAVLMIHNYHFMAKNRRQAAVLALTAGLDVELPTVACYGQDLLGAIQAGELPLATLDLSVSRHLQKKFELGLFENPYVDEEHVLEVFDTPAQRKLAYEIACKSLVLLKNDGLLPLPPTIRKLAVIGPNADSSRSQMGDYSYAALFELMKFLPDENASFGRMDETGLKELTVAVPTVLECIRLKFPSIEVRYARGCGILENDESGFAEAIAAVRDSDLAILVMGGRSGLTPACSTGEFRDASDLGLPGVQEKLIQEILKLGKPVVLVLMDGRPVSMPELVEPLNAILEAWVPGEEGGRAIVDALWGDINPAGRLPVSVPRSVGQVPVFYNHKPSGMRSNILVDYVNEKVTPLFPFGFGLSYTCFEYSNLTISQLAAAAGETIEISCQVKNVGKLPGDEVVQLYLCDEYASLPRPVKELKGFIRIPLKPGESKSITFQFPVNMMAYYDSDLNLVLEPGTFKLMIGSSSADIHLTGEFEVIGELPCQVRERIFVCPVEAR